MAQIVYQILSGQPNFTVHLFPTGIADDQVKTELGEYTFDDVPNGYYIVSITDANGCVGVMETSTGVTIDFDIRFNNYVCKQVEVTTTTTTVPVTTSTTTAQITSTTSTTQPQNGIINVTHIVLSDAEDNGLNTESSNTYPNHDKTGIFLNAFAKLSDTNPYWSRITKTTINTKYFPTDGERFYMTMDVNSSYPAGRKQFDAVMGHTFRYLVSSTLYSKEQLSTIVSESTNIDNIILEDGARILGDYIYTGSFIFNLIPDVPNYIYLIWDYRYVEIPTTTTSTTTTTLPPVTTTTTIPVTTTTTIPPLSTVFVPDAFSPNGDGVHDTFDVYNLQYYPNNEMWIFYSDGGATIYHTTQYHLNPWNGAANNNLLPGKVPVGTYYYVLKINGATIRKSFVFVSY